MTHPAVAQQAEQRLVLRPPSASAGDGFEPLFRQYGSEIRRFIRRTVGSRDDADLCQDTFLRAWRAFDAFDGRYPRAWLYRIAANACTDYLRRQPYEQPLADPFDIVAPDEPEPPPPTAEAVERVRALLAALPPRQQQALQLRLLDNLAYREVAERMGGTPEGARANVYQALRRLRAARKTLTTSPDPVRTTP